MAGDIWSSKGTVPDDNTHRAGIDITQPSRTLDQDGGEASRLLGVHGCQDEAGFHFVFSKWPPWRCPLNCRSRQND